MSKEDYKTPEGPKSSGGWGDYGKHHLADVKIDLGKHHHEVPIKRRAKASGNSKPMRFVSLHHHSTFSYKDGFQLPEAHVRRAAELNMGALALTEHGNVSSHVRLEMAAQEAGVKPIYGVELYTGDVGEGSGQTKNHLTILARDPDGYRNMMRLVTKTFAEGFHYEPTANGAMLREHKRGLYILSGCNGSLLDCSLIGGKQVSPEEASYKRGREVARRFKRTFGDAYFIEVQAFPELPNVVRVNKMKVRIAKELRIPLVATMDVHYTYLDEAEMQMILHNIRGGGRETLEEQSRKWGYDVPLCPPANDRSIYRRLTQAGVPKAEALEAIVNTELIAQECNVPLPKLPMVKFRLPEGYDSAQQFWEEALKEGWRRRGCHRLPKAERERYRTQLLKEKQIMEDKGFIDYMLIVREGVVYIKDQGIPVGPARGSAAASLVCWLLRITEVNPMIFPNLVFERFIDVTREDYPDIDLDFPSEVRPMLRAYYEQRYGEGCVNNLGTFTYFKNKLAIDDIARVYKVPVIEVAKVKDFLIERSSGDLRASSTIEDTVDQFPQAREVFTKHPELRKAQELEGNIKGFGVHAAGLVISDQPPDEAGVCAMYQREIPKGSGNIVQVVSLDKYDAERQGMVKMDFLGLNTMSMLWAACRELGMTTDDLYNIPLDDEKVYDGFRANDVVGVFQMDGRACRYVCGALKPDNFAEVCDVNALARPGALHNGAAREYSGIKHGIFKPNKIHPAVDAILEPTQYQIVYQEQILRICREVGNFPWEKTAEIRKIIAKKHGDAAFNRRKAAFMEGADTVHERLDVPPMDRATAQRIWGEMITAGSYGFNAAHSTAYGLLAVWTMWFKQHHPAIFFATSLAYGPAVRSAAGSQAGRKGSAGAGDRARDLLRDAIKGNKKSGRKPTRVLPPDPKGGRTWEAVSKLAIRAGFEQLPNVGPSLARSIEEARDDGRLVEWDDLIKVKGIGPKKLEEIEPFVKSHDPFGAYALDRNIRKVKKQLENGELGELPLPTHTALDLPYESNQTIEVVWLGTSIQRNVRDLFEMNRARTGEELDPSKVKRPDLNEWVLVTGEDEDDRLVVEVDRFTYPRFKQAVFGARLNHDLLLVEGIRPKQALVRKIKVRNLWVIDPDD